MPVTKNETSSTRNKNHLAPPANDSSNHPVNNRTKLRKQTQDIAAKAAQRRANLHHRELMEDMGIVNLIQIFICIVFFIFCVGTTASRDPIIAKENAASIYGLEITPVKPKKTVTINDPTPNRNRMNDLRRTNSDSPELIPLGKRISLFFFLLVKLLIFKEPILPATNHRAAKTQSKKRSICKLTSKSTFALNN